jgi:hypothetical protein
LAPNKDTSPKAPRLRRRDGAGSAWKAITILPVLALTLYLLQFDKVFLLQSTNIYHRRVTGKGTTSYAVFHPLEKDKGPATLREERRIRIKGHEGMRD